ncbi:MAG: hypothetical protein ACRETM_13300 [Stenotrophobium sp.]
MAALRVYLAIALNSDFDTKFAEISISDLEEVTGLSRPMVVRGIKTAEEMQLLIVDRENHRHGYTMATSADSKGFAKLPKQKLKGVLNRLPARGYHALDALKLYITLLTVRPNKSAVVQIGHTRILEWTGLQPNRVRAAIDVLINHGLVHLDLSEVEDKRHRHNQYEILGLNLAGSKLVAAQSVDASSLFSAIDI